MDLKELICEGDFKTTAHLRKALEKLLPAKQQTQAKKLHDFDQFFETVVEYSAQQL
jgi:hypothetical protein